MFRYLIAVLLLAIAPALAHAQGRQDVYYYNTPATGQQQTSGYTASGNQSYGQPAYVQPTYAQPSYSQPAPAYQTTSNHRPTSFNWQGFYAGATIGYGTGTSRRDFPQQGTSTGNFDISGIIGGGTIGYNLPVSSTFVLGLEGDMSGSGASGHTPCPGFSYTCHTDNEWLATIRPRLGLSLGPVMPYVTGGLAVGQEHVYSRSFFAFAPVSDYTSVQAGWTAGGGIELPVVDRLTLKAEYLYVNLGDANGPASNGSPSIVHFDENIGRVGVNYLF